MIVPRLELGNIISFGIDDDGPDAWKRQGNCLGLNPNFMFPSKEGGFNEAKKVCTECPVKVECLEYALKNKINEGVWGGASERERRRIARQHRKQA